MPDFFVKNNVYQLTADVSQPVQAADTIEPRAVFSISASNQLNGTAWVARNGQQEKNDLGQLSYLIKDYNGDSIGIGQTGLLPDINGLYQLGPVSAALIQDLTHYTIDIIVTVGPDEIYGVVAITLGE